MFKTWLLAMTNYRWLFVAALKDLPFYVCKIVNHLNLKCTNIYKYINTYALKMQLKSGRKASNRCYPDSKAFHTVQGAGDNMTDLLGKGKNVNWPHLCPCVLECRSTTLTHALWLWLLHADLSNNTGYAMQCLFCQCLLFHTGLLLRSLFVYFFFAIWLFSF